jgi:ABC-type antimicrobial peptide transport system permease subunit
VASGLPAAWLLTGSLQEMLFGVTSSDPVASTIAAVTLSGTAIVGSLVPSLRATRVSPMSALREE